MSGKGFISDEEPKTCEFCGKFEECRPYGPKGEQVCFKCGMKDQEACRRGMNRYVYGEGNA